MCLNELLFGHLARVVYKHNKLDRLKVEAVDDVFDLLGVDVEEAKNGDEHVQTVAADGGIVFSAGFDNFCEFEGGRAEIGVGDVLQGQLHGETLVQDLLGEVAEDVVEVQRFAVAEQVFGKLRLLLLLLLLLNQLRLGQMEERWRLWRVVTDLVIIIIVDLVTVADVVIVNQEVG